MTPFEEGKFDLPSRFVFGPRPNVDWIDMAFVLQEIEGELRAEVLGIVLETSAKMHENIAEGMRSLSRAVQGAQD